jgi:hypothetical protein
MKLRHNHRTSSVKYLLAGMAGLTLLRVPSVFAACSNTSSMPDNLHYQVTDRWDPILHQHWISVADCNHPERPSLSRLDNSTSMKTDSISAPANHLWNNPAASGQPTLVHAGENVRVFRQEDTLRVEIHGVAEQNAGLGKPVRVRLPKVGIDAEQAQKEIVAVVSGPAAVEMQP